MAVQTGQAQILVTLSPCVEAGFVFVIVNAVALLATCLCFGKGHIPKQFVYVAVAIYAIYLVTAISLQFSRHDGFN